MHLPLALSVLTLFLNPIHLPSDARAFRILSLKFCIQTQVPVQNQGSRRGSNASECGTTSPMHRLPSDLILSGIYQQTTCRRQNACSVFTSSREAPRLIESESVRSVGKGRGGTEHVILCVGSGEVRGGAGLCSSTRSGSHHFTPPREVEVQRYLGFLVAFHFARSSTPKRYRIAHLHCRSTAPREPARLIPAPLCALPACVLPNRSPNPLPPKRML